METNELTRTLKTQLIPKAALIAYASEDDKNFFLEIRDINDRGNMAEGRPITQEFMNELVKGYSERHSMTCPKIALHSNNYKKCTSYD